MLLKQLENAIGEDIPWHCFYRWPGIAHSGYRCGDCRPAYGKTFIELDWIQALRKWRYNVGYNDYRSVLIIGRDADVGPGAQESTTPR